MRRLQPAIISAALLLLSAAPSSAQDSSPRQGFWWGLGASLGWGHVTCDICLADRQTGPSVNIRAGITAGPNLLLGLEASGWLKSEESVTEKLVALKGVAFWYPNARSGLHLELGLGLVGYRSDGEDGTLTSTGFGPALGVGYDFRVASSVSLTPYLHASVSVPTAELNFEGERVTDGVGLSLIQIGLDVTWH
jgi:hypothetical protein